MNRRLWLQTIRWLCLLSIFANGVTAASVQNAGHSSFHNTRNDAFGSQALMLRGAFYAHALNTVQMQHLAVLVGLILGSEHEAMQEVGLLLGMAVVPPNAKQIGRMVKEGRERAGLSTEDLSSRTGLPEGYIRSIERGDPVASREVIVELGNTLGFDARSAFRNAVRQTASKLASRASPSSKSRSPQRGARRSAPVPAPAPMPAPDREPPLPKPPPNPIPAPARPRPPTRLSITPQPAAPTVAPIHLDSAEVLLTPQGEPGSDERLLWFLNTDGLVLHRYGADAVLIKYLLAARDGEMFATVADARTRLNRVLDDLGTHNSLLVADQLMDQVKAIAKTETVRAYKADILADALGLVVRADAETLEEWIRLLNSGSPARIAERILISFVTRPLRDLGQLIGIAGIGSPRFELFVQLIVDRVLKLRRESHTKRLFPAA